MTPVLFLVLFGLGFLLAFAGGIIGVVEAFRVNVTWGLLYLFVPFAALVFIVKFWQRKWVRNSFFMSLGGLVLALLSFFGLGTRLASLIQQQEAQEEQLAEEAPIEGEPLPAEEPQQEEPQPDTSEEEAFEEPLTPTLPSATEIASAELIQSTDPDERVQEVTGDRPDPYATVPVPPPPTEPLAPEGAPGGQPGQEQPQQQGQPGTTPGETTPPDGETPSPIQPLPTLPDSQTVAASSVQVTGVVQINGARYAIVKAPGEPTSRYVRVGDRLANGTILVKRIETRSGSQPTVVLEENGIEVALPVGSGGSESEQETAAGVQPPALPDVASLDLPELPE